MTDETFFVYGFGTGTADELAAHIAQLRIERDAAIGDKERADRRLEARLPNTLAIDFLFAALEPALDEAMDKVMDKVIEARVEAALAEFTYGSALAQQIEDAVSSALDGIEVVIDNVEARIQR